jgi:hypothetical protein
MSKAARIQAGTLLLTLSLAASCGEPGPSDEPVAAGSSAVNGPIAVDPAKELLVTDLSVVNDPVRTVWDGTEATGHWSFSRNMYWMNGKKEPSRFILEWLRTWERDQDVGGAVSKARPNIRKLVINPWLAVSKKADGKTPCDVCTPSATNDCSASDFQCTLDLTKEPFRLLAIVNRVDLRSTVPGAFNAGEGRFVYGVLRRNPMTNEIDGRFQFTVILEYEQPAKDVNGVRSWAKDWHALGGKSFKDKQFNQALAQVTEKWAANRCKGKPNDSCINQIRTNEVSLDPTPTEPAKRIWELREFRLRGQPARFAQHAVAQTPRIGLHGTDQLATFINKNQAAIEAGTHVVPKEFLGADSPGIVSNKARHLYGLATCDGCHTAETIAAGGSADFTHVKVREAHQESALSPFLRGTTSLDPKDGSPHAFNDLQRRADDLRDVLTKEERELKDKPRKARVH